MAVLGGGRARDAEASHEVKFLETHHSEALTSYRERVTSDRVRRDALVGLRSIGASVQILRENQGVSASPIHVTDEGVQKSAQRFQCVANELEFEHLVARIAVEGLDEGRERHCPLRHRPWFAQARGPPAKVVDECLECLQNVHVVASMNPSTTVGRYPLSTRFTANVRLAGRCRSARPGRAQEPIRGDFESRIAAGYVPVVA